MPEQNIDPGQNPGAGEQSLKEIKDPVSGKMVKVPADVESLIGHMVSTTRKKADEDYKPILDKVSKLEGTEGELEDLKSQLEKMRLDSLSAEERAAENAKKVIQEAKKEAEFSKQETGAWKKRFEETTVRNDILSAFAGTKLCNPEQVAILLEREGNARVEEIIDSNSGKPTGRFETRVTLTIEDEKGKKETLDGTPKELFKKWISMEVNSHHVQVDIKPGAGTGKKVQLPSGEKVDMSTLDPVARMNIERERQRAK
jgi:hypothetical protein